MRHGSTLALLALLLAAGPPSALAGDRPPLPDSRRGYSTQPLLLLSRPDVRDDLKMNAEQTASAERAIADFYVRAYKLRGLPTNPETIRLRGEVDRAAEGWIEGHLVPEQKTRLIQVHLQWEGPAALIKRPFVADTLRLTAEQKATLAQAMTARDAARSLGEPGADLAFGQAALRCLDPSQRESWARMMGPPIALHLADGAPPKPLR